MVCDPGTLALAALFASGATAWATADNGGPPPEQIQDIDLDDYSEEELKQALREFDQSELVDEEIVDDIDIGNDRNVPDFLTRSSTNVDPDGLGFSDVDDSFDRQLMERRHCDSRNNSSSSDDPSFEEIVREWE